MSQVINVPGAPPPIGPYVPGRKAGNFLYTSGNVAVKEDGSTPESVYEQTTLSLLSLEQVLLAAGYSRSDVVRCGCYLADMNDFAEMNKAYAAFFGDHKPCRTTIQAGKLCDPFKFEVDAVAYKE